MATSKRKKPAAWLNACVVDASTSVDKSFVSAMKQFQIEVGVQDDKNAAYGCIAIDWTHDSEG